MVVMLVVSVMILMVSSMVYGIGVNYGQLGDNLPEPEKAISLLKQVGAKKVKMYDSNVKILKAFANTGIEFVVAIPNGQLSAMGVPTEAEAWLKTNIQPFVPATKITCITVGNEVLTLNDPALSASLFLAMQNVYAGLVKLGLNKQVSVTTAHQLGVLGTSFPPSAGAFRSDLKESMAQILNFHAKTRSSLYINAYPFFAYMNSPKEIPLDYVLFEPNSGSTDPGTNLHYENMLFAQIDAVYTASAALGHKKVPVEISETGWPSKGDAKEVGATPENARKYNGNLIKLLSQNKGTPMYPNADLSVYIFALFNENQKTGNTSERNYGLFKPDGTPAYQLQSVATNGGNSTKSSGKGDSANAPASSTSSSTTAGYLNISSRAGKLQFGGYMVVLYGILCAYLVAVFLFD